MFTSKTRTAALMLALGLLSAGVGTPAQRPAPKAAEGPATPRGAAGGADAHGDPIPEGALVRLGTTRFRERGVIFTIAYSPDGKTLLSAGFRPGGPFGDGDPVVLWDAATGKPLHQFRWKRQTESARLVAAYSADGKTAAACFGDPGPGTPVGKTDIAVNDDGAVGRVVLWDAETETELREIAVGSAGTLPKNPLVLSRDGKTLFTGEPSGHVFLMQEKKEGAAPNRLHCRDATTGKERWGRPGFGYGVYCLALSPDGKVLASAGENGRRNERESEIILWDAAGGDKVRAFPAVRGVIDALVFAPDGKTLISTGIGGAAALWDVDSGKRLQELLTSENEAVFDAAVSPDGKTLATAETHGVVRLRDAATGREVRRLRDKGEFVRSLDFTPDGRTLAAGDGCAIVSWDVKTGKEVFPAEGHRDLVRAAAFSPVAPLLATAADDGVVILWDAAAGKEVRRFVGHTGHVVDIAFSPDGKLLASVGVWYEGSLRLWDVASGKELARYEAGGCNSGLAFSPDGHTLAACGNFRGAVRVWRVVDPDGAVAAGGEPIREFRLHDRGLRFTTAFSPAGKTLASADDPDATDGPVPLRLWDWTTGKGAGPLGSPKGEVIDALAFSPDGAFLASAEKEGTDWFIRLQDVASGKEVRRWKAGGGALVYSPDGKTLAESTSPSTVRMWEVATGSERRRFRGGVARAFSADGRTLAAADADATALLWDMAGATNRRPAAPTVGDPDALWRDLADADAGRADPAMRALIAGGGAVPTLRERLRPVDAAEAKRAARLLADLDAEDFDTREKATKDWEKVVDGFEPLLRGALEGEPSEELRQRAERVLDRVKSDSPARLRALRATEVLERVGSPEAKELLQSLAAGAPGAFLTRQAKASLGRLGK